MRDNDGGGRSRYDDPSASVNAAARVDAANIRIRIRRILMTFRNGGTCKEVCREYERLYGKPIERPTAWSISPRFMELWELGLIYRKDKYGNKLFKPTKVDFLERDGQSINYVSHCGDWEWW